MNQSLHGLPREVCFGPIEAAKKLIDASPAQFRRSPQLLSLARASGFATDPI